MSFYSKIVGQLNAAARTKDAAKVALVSREAVRSAVKFLFEKKGVEWDEKTTLLELIHSRTVEEFVAVPEQIAALDFVRMLGSNAEHGAHVKKTLAARAEKTSRDFAALVGAAFEPGSVIAPDVRQDLSEAETRKLYIDAYLEEAGWKVSTVKGELVPGGASIEYKVTGMPPNGQDGYCDYVLFGNDGKPLAVVEAKKTAESEEKGRTQVKLYGERLEAKFGVKPVLYYTNGYRIQCLDRVYSEPRRIVAFHTLKELERLRALQARGPIGDLKPNPDIAGRPYQMMAIASLCEHFDGKHRKGLLVLATGTGKTRVSIALVDGADASAAKGDVVSVRKTAKALLKLGAIPEILAKANELNRLVSDELWAQPTLEEVEEFRRAVRLLVPYLKGQKKAIVTLSISDEVEELPAWGWKIDIKTYREKVIDYLQTHSDAPVIAKIRKMEKLTAEDMDEIEKVCFKELGTKADFEEENKDNEGRSLAGFLRSLTGLDQDAVNNLFGEFLQGGNLNAEQQMFVSEVIDYIRANGEITVGILNTESPFDDYDLSDLFGSNLNEFKKLKDRINGMLPMAV